MLYYYHPDENYFRSYDSAYIILSKIIATTRTYKAYFKKLIWDIYQAFLDLDFDFGFDFDF